MSGRRVHMETDMTKKELYATAKTLNIRGRSKMNKAELERAIQMTTGQDAPQPQETEVFDTNPVASLAQDQNLEKGQLVNFIHLDTRERDEMEVLFDDPSPQLYDDRGAEAGLNELIELQHRMAKGMAMVEEMTQYRNNALQDYILNKMRFTIWMDRLERGEKYWESLSPKDKTIKFKVHKDWKQNIWDNALPIRDLRNKAYKAYEAHKEHLKSPHIVEYMSTLWDQWHALKDEGCELASSMNLWYKYFRLVEDENHLDFTGFDPEDIDTQKLLFDEMEQVHCLKDTHMTDVFAKPMHWEFEPVEELPVKTSGYVPFCKNLVEEWAKMGESVAHIVDHRGRVLFRTVVQAKEETHPQSDLLKEWAELDKMLFSSQVADEEELNSYA